jgi:predicted  nucleic acid-binding Zn-ribbon protein
MALTPNTSKSHDPGSFFAKLRICVLTSFVLLVAATALKLPSVVAMIGGGAPLVYYHLFYLTPRAHKGLSQTAIDSVYYFGFLVTIAALGVSAVSLAVSGGKEPLTNVAFQFGLGLLATGYAVWARMHLNSISSGSDESSPEEVLDRYVQRSKELVLNVEMASTQFSALANNLMARSQEVADNARAATEKSMLDVARLFDEQLRNTFASAREGLTEIRGLVQETSFTQEREELVRSVKLTLEAVTALNTNLKVFAIRSEEGARSSQHFSAAQLSLNEKLVEFQDRLERLGDTEGRLTATSEALLRAQSTVAEGTAQMGGLVMELADMSSTVTGVGKSFKSMRNLANAAHEQLNSLVSSAQKLGDATAHIEKSAAATEGLSAGLERTVGALPALSERVSELDGKLSSLVSSTTAVEQKMRELPASVESVVGLGGELKEALQKMSKVVQDTSEKASTMVSNGAQHLQDMEQAQRLLHDTTKLQTTTDSLQSLLAELGGTVQSLHKNLHESTGTLKSAIDDATVSLETSVKRSGDVAELFGERMSSVAQIIIDRTREGSSS